MDQGIDTTTIYGKLQFNILAAIGEFERGLIRERSLEGREKAKARGVVFGAKPKLTPQEIVELLNDYETPGCSKREIAEHYGISTSSVYRLYYEKDRHCLHEHKRPPDDDPVALILWIKELSEYLYQ
jgi:DNA invertase Pin-like site-specific DNA recombinase